MILFQAQAANPVRRVSDCSIVHPTVNSCVTLQPIRFLEVFWWMLPVYGALHFVPMVLFKWRLFLKDPKSMLLRAGLGTARSSTFLGVFVIIFQSMYLSALSFSQAPSRLGVGIVSNDIMFIAHRSILLQAQPA